MVIGAFLPKSNMPSIDLFSAPYSGNLEADASDIYPGAKFDARISSLCPDAPSVVFARIAEYRMSSIYVK